MTFYRISNHPDLSGLGGEIADARWHTRKPGRRIVYLADHPASCLLEMLVHVDREEELPGTFQLLSVDIPDELIVEVDHLPYNWRHDLTATQQIGNEFLELNRFLAMRVPSVITPVAMNCLLNPRFPAAAELQITNLGRHSLDKRLRP